MGDLGIVHILIQNICALSINEELFFAHIELAI